VFDHVPEISLLTYLDADLYFFSKPDPIFEEIGDRSIAVVEHRFPARLRHFEAAGKYNVGWISFRRDDEGLECLRVWREQCLAWCHDYPDDGRYGDQKYLDAWPRKYHRLVTLQHKGLNVAPWNLANHEVSVRKDCVWIGDQPLLCFHFHGLHALRRHVYDARLGGYDVPPSRVVARDIYGRYIDAVERIATGLPMSFAPPALSGGQRDVSADAAGRHQVSWWRRRADAIIGDIRVWKNAMTGRYLVVWNGRVITTGR
jgi:hypothetical protein